MIPVSYAGVAQLVEHYLAKVDVASSNLVSRSKRLNYGATFQVRAVFCFKYKPKMLCLTAPILRRSVVLDRAQYRPHS